MKQHRLSTKAVTLFIIIIGSLLLVPCIVTAEELQPAALLRPRMKPLDKSSANVEPETAGRKAVFAGAGWRGGVGQGNRAGVGEEPGYNSKKLGRALLFIATKKKWAVVKGGDCQR